jgi:hypothetical protein
MLDEKVVANEGIAHEPLSGARPFESKKDIFSIKY